MIGVDRGGSEGDVGTLILTHFTQLYTDTTSQTAVG